MEKHVTAVAILHIGSSIIGIIIGIFLFTLLGFLGTFVNEHEARFILPLIALFIGGGLIAISIAGIIGGLGLLKHKEWARILVLVLSAVSLMNIPIGTAIGVYSIWALVQDETTRLFHPQLVPAQTA
jgi:hypothetical protein